MRYPFHCLLVSEKYSSECCCRPASEYTVAAGSEIALQLVYTYSKLHNVVLQRGRIREIYPWLQVRFPKVPIVNLANLKKN